MAVIATINAAFMMSTIDSSSPIEIAARSQSRLFFLYVVVLIIGAIAAALMTVFVYRAGNRYQAVVQTDADARIKAADTRAEEARRGAAEARAESDKANVGLAKSNVEIARLTADAERAQAERAEADKQIAIAKADAARAKEGIANAEARSLEASVEVSRLRVTVANAEKERALAQTALLELQERIKPRHVPKESASRFIAELEKFPNGVIDIGFTGSSGSGDAYKFAQELLLLFKAAGWTVRNETMIANHLDAQVVGMAIFMPIKPDDRDKPIPRIVPLTPQIAALQSAFTTIGIPLEFMAWPFAKDETLEVVVGSKPEP